MFGAGIIIGLFFGALTGVALVNSEPQLEDEAVEVTWVEEDINHADIPEAGNSVAVRPVTPKQ